MPLCLNCKTSFSSKLVVDGKMRNLQNRRYCLSCSPWGTRFIRGKDTASPLRKYKTGIRCRLCGKPNNRPKGTCCGACNSQIRRIRNKLFAVAYLGGKCSVCGFSASPWAFVFHHRDAGRKEFAIGQASAMKWASLLKELEKCELVCANCHMIHHSNRRCLDTSLLEAVKQSRGRGMDERVFEKALKLLR